MSPLSMTQSGFLKSMAVSALVLAAFALIGTALVALTNTLTAPRIVANEKAQRLKAFAELIDPARYDNQLDADTITVRDPGLLGTQDNVLVYRARKNGQPVALLLAVVAPDGYSGNINLLVGINSNGSLSGVRVTGHRETPGLGDGIEVARSDWILGFNGKSIAAPEPAGWRVLKDGGEFDQFTGATITPRAVVAAVFRALQYYRENTEMLFATTTSDE